MATLSLVVDNPFRVLGVYSNSPVKDRLANKNRMNAFLRVGKTVSFPIDLTSLVGAPARSVDSLSHAESQINLTEDSLRHSLFWFINADTVDAIALGNLQSGNVAKAREILEKRKTFSTAVNLAVLDFVEGNVESGVARIFSMIHDDELRNSFIEAVCGNRYECSETQLAQLFSDELAKELGLTEVLSIYYEVDEVLLEDCQYLCDKLGKHISTIVNAEIEKAQSVRRGTESSMACLTEASRLKNTVAPLIDDLQEYLDETESHHQVTCDNLAKELNQLVLAYLNREEANAVCDVNQCKLIISYAENISVSKLVKSEIEETFEKLEAQELINQFSEEYDGIAEAVSSAFKKQASIDVASTLLLSVDPMLKQIESKLGNEHPFYVTSSSFMVNSVLSIIIKTVNELQKKPAEQIVRNGSLEATVHNSVLLLNRLCSYKCDPAVRRRLNENLMTLKKMDLEITSAIEAAKRQHTRDMASGVLYRFIGWGIVLGLLWLFS